MAIQEQMLVLPDDTDPLQRDSLDMISYSRSYCVLVSSLQLGS